MHVKGRHVTQDTNGVTPQYHEIQGIGKPHKFVTEVKRNGVIRIDDENHPEFWLEITLSEEDLDKLYEQDCEHCGGRA